MKKNILAILLFITLFGCGKTGKGEEIIFRKGVIYTLNGESPYTGYGLSYYDDDHIESEGNAISGKATGEWVYYYYNGKIKKKGSYNNGKLDGEWIYFFHNGELEGKAYFHNGHEIKQ